VLLKLELEKEGEERPRRVGSGEGALECKGVWKGVELEEEFADEVG